MPSSGLHGPHSLTANGVANNVQGLGPGVYALGKTVESTFVISYVGRSDGQSSASG